MLPDVIRIDDPSIVNWLKQHFRNIFDHVVHRHGCWRIRAHELLQATLEIVQKSYGSVEAALLFVVLLRKLGERVDLADVAVELLENDIAELNGGKGACRI